jgi:hypothetical protein
MAKARLSKALNCMPVVSSPMLCPPLQKNTFLNGQSLYSVALIELGDQTFVSQPGLDWSESAYRSPKS